jgi:hypothetical protein
MSLTYTLVRECLNNVEDVAGRWQIEGGKVLEKESRSPTTQVSSESVAALRNKIPRCCGLRCSF